MTRVRAPRPIPARRLVATADISLTVGALLGAIATGAPGGLGTRLLEVLSTRVGAYELALMAAFCAAVAAVFARAGLYDGARLRRRAGETLRVVLATSAVTGLAAALIASIDPSHVQPATLFRFWIAGTAALGGWRLLRAALARAASGRPRVVIVGSGDLARGVCRELLNDPLIAYQVIGFIDTSDEPRSPFITRRTLGTFDALEQILVRDHVDEVHIALPVKSLYPQIQDTIRICERIGVKAIYGADIFGTDLATPRLDRRAGVLPRIELPVVADGWRLAVKRGIDIALATAALTVLAPLMIAAAIAVKVTSKGPVIYAQERYALNRRRFRMFKFRTMVQDADQRQAGLESSNEADGPVFKMTRDPRITPLGRWLRRTSIDELPQLFNVLASDMSLVGPRPLPLRDVRQFTRAADMRRFSVRPGLTGLWQVSGRSALNFNQWMSLDLRYIDTWSLALDALILARTLPAVIRGTGAA